MLRRRVNGYDIAHIELGEGAPLVCVHGTLGDFRVWSPVLGPLSRRRRVLAFEAILPHLLAGLGVEAAGDAVVRDHV